MKKIRYFITILLLFLFISDAKALEWKCMSCSDDGGYGWTNHYDEASLRCNLSESSGKCGTVYSTDDIVSCTYEIDRRLIFNYDTEEVDEVQYPDSFWDETTIIIEYNKNNNKRLVAYRQGSSGDIDTEVSIEEKDFKDGKKFYCPEYIYGDAFENNPDTSLKISGTSVLYVDINNNDGLPYIIKNEYKLTSTPDVIKQNFKCFRCSESGKYNYYWTNTNLGSSPGCYDVGITVEQDCVSPDIQCYDIKEYQPTGAEKKDHKKQYKQYYKLGTSGVAGSIETAVDKYMCSVGVENLDKQLCSIYTNSHYLLSNSTDTIEVYKSSIGAFVLRNNEYYYIRDSIPNTCPNKVYFWHEDLMASKSTDNEVLVSGPNYYRILDDASWCIGDAFASCIEYVGEQTLEEWKEQNNKKYDKAALSCSVDHSEDLACGSLYFIPKEIPFFTNLIMNLIKIITPIVLVIKGSIDLIKAMTGGNEQEISKSRAKFFKRLIPAVLVFLIILVVQFIFGLFATDSENNTFLGCTNCFLNNDCSRTPQYLIDDFNNYCETGKSGTTNPGGNSGQGGNQGGNTTVNTKDLREKIATFALDVALRSNEFIYLVPNERDASTLTKINNLDGATGGNCLKKTYNGEKCISYNNNSYYGTDCNGFVGYVYHKSVNFESSDSRFFTPNTATGSWDLLSSASKYFTKYSSTFSGDSNGLAKLKSVIGKGDAIGRICKKTDGTYSTHIGIYVGGNGNDIVDNAGWINSKEQRIKPIKNRTLKEFLSTYTNCTLTLFQLK